MADWKEELKIQRSKQTRKDHYQQYQAYLDAVDQMENSTFEQVGKLQGKSVKKLASENNGISHLVNQFIQSIIF